MLQLPQLEIVSHAPDSFDVRHVDKNEMIARNLTREELTTWWMFNAANHLSRALIAAEQNHIVSYLPEL